MREPLYHVGICFRFIHMFVATLRMSVLDALLRTLYVHLLELVMLKQRRILQ